MKVECNVIKDLIPLYVDDYCSNESRQLVDEHMKKCDNCRASYENMKVPLLDSHDPLDIEPSSADMVIVKKGVKKIRRLWALSIIIVLLLTPIGYFTVNQIRGSGLAFTNMDDIKMCRDFLNDIKEEDFDEAFRFINWDSHYHFLITPNLKQVVTDHYRYTTSSKVEPDKKKYYETAKNYFIQDLQLLYKNGYRVVDYKFSTISKYNLREWQVEYKIYMSNSEGKKQYIGKLSFITAKNKISSISNISSSQPKFFPDSDISSNQSSYEEEQETKIIFLDQAISDWSGEAYDEFTGDDQFVPIKEHELWR